MQWKRSATLDGTVNLLNDVRGFVDIPQQIQLAQEAKASFSQTHACNTKILLRELAHLKSKDKNATLF